MITIRFADRAEAETYLRSEGFVFQGAPNRWRKRTAGCTAHAEIIARGRGVVVVIVETDTAP